VHHRQFINRTSNEKEEDIQQESEPLNMNFMNNLIPTIEADDTTASAVTETQTSTPIIDNSEAITAAEASRANAIAQAQAEIATLAALDVHASDEAEAPEAEVVAPARVDGPMTLSRAAAKEQTRMLAIVSFVNEGRHINEDGKSYKNTNDIAIQATGSFLNRPLVEKIIRWRFPEVWENVCARGRAKVRAAQKAQEKREKDELEAIEAGKRREADVLNERLTVGDLRAMLLGTKNANRVEEFIKDRLDQRDPGTA
jgi:hypothetical protein